MKELVNTLLEQATTKFELLGFDERPEARPPVDPSTLTALEHWWSERMLEPIPPSYREFLLVCDGIENFSASYHLFGARDLLSPNYPASLEKALQGGPGFDYEIERPPILIGDHAETQTRLFFEFRHERTDPREPVVLDGDPGNMTLHQSFLNFLAMSVEANNLTIAELNRVVTGDREE